MVVASVGNRRVMVYRTSLGFRTLQWLFLSCDMVASRSVLRQCTDLENGSQPGCLGGFGVDIKLSVVQDGCRSKGDVVGCSAKS